jgi:hypothetical protein
MAARNDRLNEGDQGVKPELQNFRTDVPAIAGEVISQHCAA